MIDCVNAEIRDMLPDLLHGSLNAADEERVRVHLAGCEACRDELEVITHVRALVDVPTLNNARIVAAVAPYRRRPWLSVSPAMRVAAGIVLVAVGSASYSLASRTLLGDRVGSGETAVAVVHDSLDPRYGSDGSLAGELSQLDEASLEALLSAIENSDATLSLEPRSVVRKFDLSGN